MTRARIALLPDRGVVAVNGDDARKLLQGVVTNDLDTFDHGAPAVHAGLLTAQGKILFEFLIVPAQGGFLLETARERSAALVQRLMLYKLRAKAEIKDASANYTVAALWQDGGPPVAPEGAAAFVDPRHPALGIRILASLASDWVMAECAAEPATADDYAAHRIACGVPEGGKDYELGDTFPHEANFDWFAGVSFTKGCYVGQEVVSRMQHRATVRKRVVRVTGTEYLPSGHPEVRLGEVAIGRLGTVAGREGLALIRLDRALEASDGGQPLTAGGVAVVVDQMALARQREVAGQRAAGSET